MKKGIIVLIAVILVAVAAALVVLILIRSHQGQTNANVNNTSNGTSQNATRKYCSEQGRAQVCATYYAPVCGYPIMQTFSNGCFACMNSNVQYYVNGAC